MYNEYETDEQSELDALEDLAQGVVRPSFFPDVNKIKRTIADVPRFRIILFEFVKLKG